jgi:hypothetical protein
MKSITMMSLSTKLQLANKERELLIYTQKGEVTKERGAWPPQGGRTMCKDWSCQVWESGMPPLHTCLQVSNQILTQEKVPPLSFVGCHLKRVPPLQEGRTSLIQFAHIS